MMKNQINHWMVRVAVYGLAGLAILVSAPSASAADAKAEKTFTMAVTDQQGVETELKNGIFYWEEKMSETSLSRTSCGTFRPSAARPRSISSSTRSSRSR